VESKGLIGIDDFIDPTTCHHTERTVGGGAIQGPGVVVVVVGGGRSTIIISMLLWINKK